jgi:hypothetical protein
MNKNLLVVLVLVLVIGLLAVSHPMYAHHGIAGFDLEHPITVKGTVTSFEWSNPHSYIYFDVKGGKGNVEKWRGETGGVSMMSRVGWRKDIVKPGDQITVSGNRARNGATFMRMVKVVLANGQELSNSRVSEE